MYTIVETEIFKSKVDRIWTRDERLEFLSFLSNNPLIGDVIPKSAGLRKVRWQANVHGKRGGARVIYFNLLDDGLIVALDIYTKNEKENLSQQEMKHLRGIKNEQ
ncbi:MULTISPECIES: DNA-binding protein [unclassified Lonepinella]|uniref:DNA-binding protein n=1 Tax=unclassified Lonepinella TaxID=2642006 RepID=UPI0036DF05FC